MEASGDDEKPVLCSLQQPVWPVALVNTRKKRDYARSRGILAKPVPDPDPGIYQFYNVSFKSP
jgi:hypothetical protein